jgi:phage terminase large subunit
MRELKIALQPKQKLFAQSIGDYAVTFYGGARGGGKSKGLRLIMLLRRFIYPGSHGAIFRRTYSELEGNHIRPLLEEYHFLKEYWHDSKKILTLPNGSTLQFCHCSNESDVDLYQGREFHDLAIDEAGQWVESMFRRLMASNRSSKLGIKARAILTGNPGGVGHTWLKRLFIERRFNERERPQDYNFIQAFVQDNAALLENDPDYVHRLNSEPNEALRKAWLLGDWDIFAGQFYGEIRREIHLVPNFEIPYHWRRFGAYDFGFNHPGAFGWFATDEDGNVYLYRLFVKAQLRVDQFAHEVNKFPDTQQLYPIVAGWDCWTKKGIINETSPPTIAEEFSRHGLHLKKAVIDRIQGAAQLRKYIAWQDKPNNKPKFFIFKSCELAFDCLSRMQHDPDHVEDVLKVDATEGDITTGDDTYDMIRYGLMSRPLLSDPLKMNYPYGSPEWAAQQVKQMEQNAEEHFKKLEENELSDF